MSFKKDNNLQNNIKGIYKKYENNFEKFSIVFAEVQRDGSLSYAAVSENEFMYPASVYKIFIGAEILRQAELGLVSLNKKITVSAVNEMDKDESIFPGDSRPLLKAGQEIEVDYLLDLMLGRSDNTASNMLIGLVGREAITKNIIEKYGWEGSGVTRKFLDLSKEEKRYRFSERTMSCAQHIFECMLLVQKNELVSQYVSKKLYAYMQGWEKHGTRRGAALDIFDAYARKGGFLEANLWKTSRFGAIKAMLTKRWSQIQWSHDAGIIEYKGKTYIIAVMTLRKSLFPKRPFDLSVISREIFS